MELRDAIEVLKKEQEIYKLDAANGHGNFHSQSFCEAVDVVLGFVDRSVSVFMGFGGGSKEC